MTEGRYSGINKNTMSRNLKNLLILTLILAFSYACETEESLTKRRIKEVENSLLKAVVFKGTQPEKMNLYDRMQYYKVPGVSMAVMDGFEIEWEQYYGVENVETAQPLTKETIFQTGDLSQFVSALGSLYYVEQGVIDLDKDINQYLKSWKVPSYDVLLKEKITLRRLLTHSAGFFQVEFSGYKTEETLPSLTQIIKGQEPAKNPPLYPTYEPGSEVLRSDAGFVILQLLLEDITGRSFPEIMNEVILNRIPMENSTFQNPLPDSWKSQATSGHDREGNPLPGERRIYPEEAALGLWSTVSDYAGMILEIVSTARGTGASVISSRTAREMLSPYLGLQAMAVHIEGEGDGIHFLLSGHCSGFDSFFVFYPQLGQGMVVMTNSSNGIYLIEEVLRAAASVYHWPHFQPEEKPLYQLPAEIVSQYVGRYRVSQDYFLDVSPHEHYLLVQPTGQAPTKFYLETQTTFFSTGPFTQIQFLKNREGKVTGLVLRQKRSRLEAEKIQ